jgi:sirohydrochlorin cobaltochelatase
MKALILIAHGSKKEESNEEFRDLVNTIKAKDLNKYESIETAFLEFVEPSIEEITEKLYKRGVQEITFYPYFLNSGKHVIIDIPNIMESLKRRYPKIKFIQLPHFGLSKKIASIILDEI